MRKLLLSLMALFLIAGVANATAFRSDRADLKISGTAIDATVLAANQTVTTDSIYQIGNVGYSSIATMVRGANASVTITYQVSYDNSTWWTPYTTSSGTLTSVGTISTSQTADRWVVVPSTVTLAPYIRFSFANGAAGTATITADTLWQTAS